MTAPLIGPWHRLPAMLAACMLPAALVLGGLGDRLLWAATPGSCSRCSAAAWHIVETANFRILSFGAGPVDREAAAACEDLRAKLVRQWLAAGAEPSWTPKCEIVLHPTDAAYLREVGVGGRDTVASSLVEQRQGRIGKRRIDVRPGETNWRSTALGHELTHVVLADRFAGRPLPRWADEGMAILADPAEKQARHLRDLRNALAGRAEFRLLELVTLADYPAPRRWGTFYGQSAALVQFLVDQAGPEKFVQFVERALDRGYEQALREVYDLGLADLERRWHAQLGQPAKLVSHREPLLRNGVE